MIVRAFSLLFGLCWPVLAPAGNLEVLQSVLAGSHAGWFAIGLFVLAYSLVIMEEFTCLRKSKPMILCAGLVWALVALSAKSMGVTAAAEHAFRESLTEYAELFLFILVAMTYINVMEERNVFAYWRSKLVSCGMTYRQLFWILGIASFFISAIADNLTTALLMCAIALTMGRGCTRFIQVTCVAIVVAANAGGAFSPFGDITTLMVWQKGKLDFFQFLQIFVPSVVNYLVPASLMMFAVPKESPEKIQESVALLPGAVTVTVLFLTTISLAVTSHLLLGMPPVLGMMTGLSLLLLFGYTLSRRRETDYDIFQPLARAEWDTLLFFYGVMLCIGGLAAFGYLATMSSMMFTDLGQNLSPGYQALPANVLIGLLSAIVDNIPVMYAVLTMNPQMPEGQWLMITLTAGTGGSLLAIGSAAGVALLGQARGHYTFFSHLRWSWAILLGYLASIVTLLLMYPELFQVG